MNDLMFLAADCVKDCGGADILRILKFVFILIDLVFFVVPIGLIVMLMIDFGKNVIAGKEDEMKKNVNMVIKRIIYCVVLFLVPTITNFAISLVGTDGENAVSTAAACIGYAREYTNEDLALCEIDYETFEPVNKPDNCYYCVENNNGTRIFSYVWSTSPIENGVYSNKTCTAVSGVLDENSCIEKNVTISYCYYCESSNTYVYGNMPSSSCSSQSGWQKDYYKDEEHCSSNTDEDNTDEENRESHCYICYLGNNSMYKWDNKKPTDACMSANGWQIDYNITRATQCIAKP